MFYSLIVGIRSATLLLSRSLVARGFSKTLSIIMRNIIIFVEEYNIKRFDKKYNIDTTDKITLNKLTVIGKRKKFGEGYYRTPHSVIKRFIPALPKDFSNIIFIDIGSGKGRVLFFSANYNFKDIIGLEFTQELHDICLKNAVKFINKNKNKHKSSHKIECIHVDAVDFDFPNENMAIFLFNPFHKHVL